MLAIMKRLMDSLLGKLVIMIIIAGMAFWGVNEMISQVRSGLGSNLAAAGKRQIDVAAFDKRVENLVRNMNADSAEPVTKSEIAEQGLVDQLFRLEQQNITGLGYAASIGVKPSTDAIIAELNSIEAFKNPLTGELDLNTYREVLSRNRFTKEEYEQQLADELTLDTLTDAAKTALIAPDTLTQIQTLYLGEQRLAEWFLLDTSTLSEPDAPTADEVRAFYEENIDALKQPERRMIDMLKVSPDDFLSEVEVTDQEVATIYEAAKSERFSEPDTRTYVELMFDDRAAARSAFGQLAAGADPESVEGVTSSQTRTGKAESVTDEFLREAMFGPGKQSGALFGPKQVGDQWLIARLVSVQPGAVFPLETVAEQIHDELAQEKAGALFFEKLDSLDRSIGAGYPLSQIASELNVPLITFAPVDSNGTTEDGEVLVGLLNAGDAFTQAFNVPVGETSNRFDSDAAVYLTSPRKVLEPYTPDFETVEEDVRNALIQRRSMNAVQTMVDDLTDKLEAGETTLAAEAEARNEPVESLPQPVSRLNASSIGLPRQAVSAIFSGSEGDVYTFPSPTGDLILVMQITAVTPPDMTQQSQLATQARIDVTTSLENDLAQAIQYEVAAETKLRVNDAGFAAYKNSINSDQ